MKKRETQFERIHRQQNKLNYYIDIGDTVKITCIDGWTACGIVLGFDLKVEITTKYPGLHPCMDIEILDENICCGTSIWIENITKLEVIKFKGELNE